MEFLPVTYRTINRLRVISYSNSIMTVLEPSEELFLANVYLSLIVATLEIFEMVTSSLKNIDGQGAVHLTQFATKDSSYYAGTKDGGFKYKGLEIRHSGGILELKTFV